LWLSGDARINLNHGLSPVGGVTVGRVTAGRKGYFVMASEPLPRAAQADFLTEVLRPRGAIGDASVRDVVVESSRGLLVSRVLRLRLTYDRAVAGAPASLILKTGLAGGGSTFPNIGRGEVAFYSQIAPEMTARVVPVCFDAHHDSDSREWHLLLEDLTDSHVICSAWPLPPTLAECEAIIDARARCHAEWWDDPRLGVSIGKRLDVAGLQRDMTAHFTRFVDLLGDRLPPPRRALYERFLAALPALVKRRRPRGNGTPKWNVTIVHGDAHVWNCFLPRAAGDTVRLFDWDSWRIGTATSDLAYMIAVHWYPERRQRLELPLLDRYHAVLVESGVRDYDRQALAEDYRLSVLLQLLTPVFQAAFNLPPMVWWQHLERIMLAIDDLGCRDLLDA
jgi:hypothetical protein